jgi:hypothetical protein
MNHTIHQQLAKQRQIADIWGIEDVQSVRPDLSDEQAWDVLQAVLRYRDAGIGINWEVIESHAEQLFGLEPGAEDEREG